MNGTWRVSSAAFRRRRVADGWVSSVDREARITLEEERRLRDQRHPGWGLGIFAYGDAEEEGARIEHAAEQGSEAHCSVFVGPGKAQPRAMARRVEIIELPNTDPGVDG